MASSESIRSLGFIGLGLLGNALAERARAAGLTVAGFDLEPSCCARLTALGGQALTSARDVARSHNFLVLALPDDRVTSQVLADIGPTLVPGSLIFDATTGDPEKAADFGRSLAEQDVTYLDATVSGSSAQVRLGQALFMVGGPRPAFERCQDLLQCLGGKAVHTGPCGSGAKMKLVTNLVLGLNRAALAEGLTLAKTLGLEPGQALEILQASAAYSRIMESKGPKMVAGEFEPQARLSQHLKDVRLMLETAARAGQRLPLSAVHRELLESAEALGLGSLDNSAILRAFEALRPR